MDDSMAFIWSRPFTPRIRSFMLDSVHSFYIEVTDDDFHSTHFHTVFYILCGLIDKTQVLAASVEVFKHKIV